MSTSEQALLHAFEMEDYRSKEDYMFLLKKYNELSNLVGMLRGQMHNLMSQYSALILRLREPDFKLSETDFRLIYAELSHICMILSTANKNTQ